MEEICTSIASKIVEKPVALIGRQLSYLIYYDSNIESLKDVLKRLDDKKNDVQNSVHAAKRNGEIIKAQVERWLEDVNKMFSEVQEFENEVNMQRRCMYGLCPSLKSRYSLSRKAKKIAQRVLDLKLDEGLSNNVANPAPPQQLGSIISSEGFKDFGSRKAVMNDVLSALRNEKTRIIGICGMGGVGKTRMVREIREIIKRLKGTSLFDDVVRLKGTSLFDDVVMATVSATVNIRTIQTEIAESLDMKLVEETESIRAQRLHERIKDKRILIILDDVWSELKFEAIGIPFDGCKILLTSRNEEVCKAMGCKDYIFRVQALNKEEAWELFSEAVGESMNNHPDLSHIAKLIVDECKGLPIAIITVGKALLPSNGKHEWLTALQELKNSVPENIPGMEHSVYSCIKLSYDKLESDEVKSCFLLCCLFPEDYDVPIEYLVRYGAGRATFRNTNTVEDVRNKVHSFVGQLKRRYLLLDSLKEECIKMHDIVRDVAISIASKDPHRFMVRSFDAVGGGGGWLGVQKVTNQEHCSAISLIDVKLDEIIIDGLEFPKLELLQLKNSSSSSEYSNHFKRLRELKVLAFLGMDMSSYLASKKPLPLGEPKYLHTLCLEDCKLGDISHVIGGLENLEILSFARSQINNLPREIGLLHRLRMLDATDCEGLEEIPHGVLSNLRRLEELYMAESFLNWGPATGSKDETSMASLDEVMSLSDHLNVLAIKIHDVQMLRNDEFLLKSQPIRFHVSINISWSYKKESFKNRMPGYLFENSLMLRGDVKEYLEIGAVRYFLKQSEDLSLHHTYNLKSLILLKQSDDPGGFQHLKVLSIMYDKNIEYLMNGTDCTRQQSAFPNLKSATFKNVDKRSFMNLRSIAIDSCDELKYVFSLSVAQNLVQLQSLTVENCAKVEEIISKERMENDNASHRITFPRLTVLKLSVLLKLRGFYTRIQRDPTYEIIKPNDESVNKMKETRNDNQITGSTSSKSKVAQVGASCHALFPSNCISWLPNLEQLQLWYLTSEQGSEENSELEELTGDSLRSTEGSEENSEPEELVGDSLRGMEALEENSEQEELVGDSFRGMEGSEENSAHEELVGDSLTSEQGSKENNEPVVNVVFDLEGHVSACSQLQILDVVGLDEVEHLWRNVQLGFQGFQNVRSLTIEDCNSLKYLCPYEIYKLLVNLQLVDITNCRNMETIVLAPASTEDNIHEEGKEIGGSGAMTSLLPQRTVSSSSSTGCGCAPLVCLQSRPSTRNFTQILPRPVNREVTSANLQASTSTIYVENCSAMEKIFVEAKEGGESVKDELTFPHVNSIKLQDLPKLESFWSQAYTLNCPSLKILQVEKCPKLKVSFQMASLGNSPS